METVETVEKVVDLQEVRDFLRAVMLGISPFGDSKLSDRMAAAKGLIKIYCDVDFEDEQQPNPVVIIDDLRNTEAPRTMRDIVRNTWHSVRALRPDMSYDEFVEFWPQYVAELDGWEECKDDFE